MQAIIATDVSIHICNGKYYYASQVSAILKRYYENYGALTICGRVVRTNETPSSLDDITEMVNDVVEIPSLGKVMLGLCNKKIRQAVASCDLVICRCHGITPLRAADAARKLGKPYFAEVMGCAWDAFWNHGLAGKLMAPYMFFKTKQTLRDADYALYVTNGFLQKRYPCKNDSIGASNVLIKNIDEAVLKKRLEKIANTNYHNLTLMTTAAIDVKYKGQEFVIKAIPALNKAGIRVRYLLVGGGDSAYLKKVAASCDVEDQVEFIGRRSLAEVFELLDETDIYIQPSLQEGLPRSVIEAMSRACPAIGAKTAGIPELIAPECVVARKSAADIAQTIIRITNAEKMAELAGQNFEKAKDYQDAVLSERRNAYYQKVLERINKHGEKPIKA